MGVTSDRLLKLGLVDRVVEEPLGGAHRNPDEVAQSLKTVLVEELAKLNGLTTEALLSARAEKLRAYGQYKES